MMGKLAALGRFFTLWYVGAALLAALGLAAGGYLFFQVTPGKPKIGVIDIPFTGIGEDAAAIITAYLDYARREPDIKGVVVKLSTPGGGASPSEQLYIEARKLRAEKPVVMVMNGLVASGGYMMAMGVNHTYVKTSSIVGNVGVVAPAGGILAPVFPESVITTGPQKLTGATRRDWVATMDGLKEAFVEMVVQERGEKLKMSREELAAGRVYSGMEAVRLGLADEVGSDSDAMEKAAELAGIGDYEIVNVNVEVNRLLVQNLRRIYSASGEVDTPLTAADAQLMGLLANRRGMAGDAAGPGLTDAPQAGWEDDAWAMPGEPVDLAAVERPLEYGVFGAALSETFPEFPIEINQPEFYYLYVGAAP